MTPFENAEDEDTQVIEQDEASEIGEDDRVEWRKQNGQPCSGTVLTDDVKEGLIVIADVPTGEPCPVLWGPVGIFSKID